MRGWEVVRDWQLVYLLFSTSSLSQSPLCSEPLREALMYLFFQQRFCLFVWHRNTQKWEKYTLQTRFSSSTFNPKYCQIPGSSGTKQISRCRAWQECHRSVSTLAGIFSLGKRHGKGVGICLSQGGSRGDWGRCCHTPMRFPPCILGLCPSCGPLTSLSDAKAIIDHCMSYCWPVFCFDFLIVWKVPQQTRPQFETDDYFHGYCNPGNHLCTWKRARMPASVTHETIYYQENQDGV